MDLRIVGALPDDYVRTFRAEREPGRPVYRRRPSTFLPARRTTDTVR